jgi:bifunctional non-homologous end joining protein LigD
MAARRKKAGSDKLAEYRRKRSAGATPEPFVQGKADRPGLFVVHKHWASHMHYDLRLEMGGVLMSWAVPKGPSMNPADKRLAMHVEDHPLEYGDFEGIIPEGNYGAGAVIVWDRGLWVPIEGEKHGMEHGKLLFDLKGYKLRGRWTIFKTKRGKNEWLLVKKPDGFADKDGSREPGEGSVFSGLTVEELRQGKDPAARIRAALKCAKAPKGKVDPRKVGVMLAQQRDEPFSDPGWVFEIKYDGYRLLAAREGKKPLLRYRRGQEVTSVFPEIAKTLAKFPHDRFVLDGEVVVLDEDGKPSFQRLQQRVQLKRPHDIARASVRLPATLFVFDLLAFEDHDLRTLPLLERKKILELLLPRAGALRYSDHIPEAGEAMYEHVQEMRLEGLIAKRADSRYAPGRSADWLKIRVDHTGDFAVVGYSPPKRARTGFGALHVAYWEQDGFVYAGRVGSGFSDRQLKDIPTALDEARVDTPPCTGPTPTGKGHVWVEPFLCAEVRYKEWTAEGMLRHPVFLRLRDDKPLEDCSLPHGPTARVEIAEQGDVVHDETAQIEAPNFTNLDKIFWPEEGYTKGDLIEYYRQVSDWLVPYLEDRPVVLTRYPDGIHGKNFFQKDAPGFVPDWVRTETMWSEHAEREIHYFIAEDERSLLYLANMGTIPLHIWSSRMQDLQKPDWCILDLDPKGAPFKDVIKVAKAIRALCDEIELPSFVKTSGSSGLHVLLPLGGQCTYDQSKTLGHLIARIVSSELPKISTIARSIAAREGRVYIDFLQNGHGKLLVSPLCVRPLPGAPVSMPLKWTEVNAKLAIGKHTIETGPKRLKRMKVDPVVGVLEESPDLVGVLERLAGKVG